MTDKEFLEWIYARLVHHHNENPLYDYMHKLKAITDNFTDHNTVLQLRQQIKVLREDKETLIQEIDYLNAELSNHY